MPRIVAQSCAPYYEHLLVLEETDDKKWHVSVVTSDGRVLRSDEPSSFEDDAKSNALEFAQFYIHQALADVRPVLEHVEWALTRTLEHEAEPVRQALPVGPSAPRCAR